MGIGAVVSKVKASRVIGMDLSTKSVAFAIFDNDLPVRCGEIVLRGATPFERLKDARHKIGALVKSGYFDSDYIIIESAIMVHNVQTAIDLAYTYGAILSELSEATKELHRAAPITWQTAIGNPNLKKNEKEAIQREFPGKSKSWYSNKGREIRKQRTLDIAKQYFDIHDNSDNVGDAVGLALYATKTLTRR